MKKQFLPKVVIMELTYSCNHQCIFCSCPWENKNTYNKHPELSTEEVISNIDTLKKHGVKHITLSGGEPFLRKDLLKIIKHISSQKLSASIITNGLLLDDTKLKMLKKYNLQLSISLPGIKTFKQHTGVDHVNEILLTFQKAKKIGLSTVANITVTKLNIKELYKNIAYPIINGADYVLLNRFIPGGRGLDNKKFLLSNDEINEMLSVAEEVLSKSNRNGHVGVVLPYCIVKDFNKYQHLHIGTKCSAAKDFFVVDPSGYIKVCNHSPNRLCQVKDISSLKENEYWSSFAKSDYIPKMCKDCAHLDICAGGCREAAHVNNGSISSEDPCFNCASN